MTVLVTSIVEMSVVTSVVGVGCCCSVGPGDQSERML